MVITNKASSALSKIFSLSLLVSNLVLFYIYVTCTFILFPRMKHLFPIGGFDFPCCTDIILVKGNISLLFVFNMIFRMLIGILLYLLIFMSFCHLISVRIAIVFLYYFLVIET